MDPLAELKALDRAVDQATELNVLRPIFYRLDEIARNHTEDVEVQVAIGDVKQHILVRGNLLTERNQTEPDQGAPGGSYAHPAPPLEDDSPTASRTVILPVPQPPERARGNDASNIRPPLPLPPGPPPEPPGPTPAPPRAGGMGRVIAAFVAIAILAAIAMVVVIERKRASMIAMHIVTVPPGAAIRVTGAAGAETKCVSDCTLSLPAGAYQIAASLDGYEAGAESATLAANQPGALNLILQPQPQTVRIHADLPQGRVIFDNMLPVALQDGEYTIEKVMPGRHTVKVMGARGDTSFSFDVTPAKQPGIMGTVEARDVLTVLVASFSNRARLVTSSGPWKLEVNGHAENDAGPAGVEIENLNSGDDELIIGEGNDRHSLKEHFGSDAALTVFVTADPNEGTLIVSTGESGVRVFLNDKEYPLRTQEGVLQVQTAGPVAVRVAKDGFEEPPAQVAEVKKAARVRLEFKMVPSPGGAPPH